MFLQAVETLGSPETFAAFQRRAGFVLKSPFLMKEYSDKERAMLDAISHLPKGDYSANARKLKTTYPLDQLDELVKKVMRAVEGRRSLASTVKTSRSSSRSSFSSDDEVAPARVLTPRKVDPVVGIKRRPPPPPPVRGRSPIRSPSPPLITSPALSPLSLGEETPLRVGSPPPVKERSLKPRRAKSPLMSPPAKGAETPVRPMSPLSLGEQTPLRANSPPVKGEKTPVRPMSPLSLGEQTPLRVGSPPVNGGQTPLRVASPPLRGESTPLRVGSPPLVSPRGPLKKQRSFIESGSALDLLKIPREYNIAVQGAICLKFLFPEAHKKLFPKEEDQRMVDAVIRSHGLIRYVGYSRDRAIDEAFKDEPKELFSVLHRLGKQQTLSQIAKPPTLKDFPPLAPVFYQDPRLTVDQLPGLIEIMGKIRYQCLGIYTMMSKERRRGLNCFCTAGFVQEMIGWPLRDCLQVAFRGKYPTVEELDLLIREVTLSDSLHPMEMAPRAPRSERSIEEVFAYPFLKYPILFRQLLKHVAQFRPEERHLFFPKQIEAVYTLKEQALLSHEAAVQRCFAKSALEKHFVGDERWVEKTIAELERLSPHPTSNHPLLKTEEGIERIRSKCQGDLQGYFHRIQDVMKQNPGMEPFLAVQAVFTRNALRLFFDSDRDYENGKSLDRLIEEAVR